METHVYNKQALNLQNNFGVLIITTVSGRNWQFNWLSVVVMVRVSCEQYPHHPALLLSLFSVSARDICTYISKFTDYLKNF